MSGIKRSDLYIKIALSLCIVLGCLAAGNGFAFTLGNTAVGSGVDTGDSGRMNAFQFTMPDQSGRVTSISVYVPAPVSSFPRNQYQVAIYSDAAGSPGTLIALSAIQAVRPNSWNRASLSVSLAANTPYWLVYNSNGASPAANNLASSPGAPSARKAQRFGSWPARFGSPTAVSTDSASIYATLTPEPTPDITPPSAPAALTAAAVSATEIDLAWGASIDNIGVTEYRIFRNGTQIATSTAASYRDAGLSPSTTFTYTVSAYDAAGNASAPSAAASATTPAAPDTTPPSAPSNLTALAASADQIDLTWNASTDNVGVAGYQIYRNGVPVGVSIVPSYRDAGLTPLTAYRYTVSAFDAAGNSSAPSAVSATTPAPPDVTPPSTPAGLSASAASSSQINLSWAASTDAEGAVAGYQIFRDGGQIATTDATSYADGNLSASTDYSYAVAAFDAAGNRSGLSNAVSARTTDAAFTLGNTAIGTLTDSSDSNYLNAFQFTMPNRNGAVASMSVYIPGPVSPSPNDLFQLAIYSDSNGNPGALIAASASQPIVADSWNTVPVLASLSANTSYWLVYNSNGASVAFNNLSLSPGGSFVWKVQSFGTWPGTFGNGNGFSSHVASIYATLFPQETTPDTAPPSIPSGLSASAAGPTQVNLAWSASTDPGGAVMGYQVFRDGVQIATAPSPSYSDGGLTAATTYAYSVAAFDAAGNLSGRSSSAFATTPAAADATPPTVSIVSPGDGATVSDTIVLSAAASDNVGVASVQFQLDGVNLGPPLAAPYDYRWNTLTASNGRHALSAIARDHDGNQAVSEIGLSVLNDPASSVTISNLDVINITADAALVTWTTDALSDSQVEYGPTSAYGSSRSSGTQETAHSVLLNGLSADTLYHLRVASRGVSQGLAVSDDVTFTTSSASSGTINGRSVLFDANNRILSWLTPQESSYDRILRANVRYLLNDIPTDPNNGLKLYYTHPYFYPRSLAPGDWSHNPAGLFAMFVDSGLAYYAYSGESGYVSLAKEVLDYDLAHGLTPATASWAGVPYASSASGATEYRGDRAGDSSGVGDGTGVIEPDKVAELGYGFLKMYKFSGEARYLDAAIQAADMLAAHVRTGDATHSPWPFRVEAASNTPREEYTADVVAPIKLLDELIRLNLGRVSSYQAARRTAWDWLMAYPIQNGVWANYFEDLPFQDNLSNVNQYVPLETARYLLLHPEHDPDWRTHVPGIIQWVETRFAQPQFGANAIGEQARYNFAMASHTSRYASVNALWYEKTGDRIAKEKAFRAFNWAMYMTEPDGFTITGIDDASASSWFSDAFGDFARNILAGLGAVPEWAPPSENHLVSSTSVILGVSYLSGEVSYRTFDAASTEVVRLNFTPSRITADGVDLARQTDLSQPGWTFDPATGVLRVYHLDATQIRIR